MGLRGKSEGAEGGAVHLRLKPGQVTEDGWTVLEGGWLGAIPSEGATLDSPNGWRMVRLRTEAEREGGITWGWMAARWDMVSQELHRVYGIDLGDTALTRARTWPWLAGRVVSLLGLQTRLRREAAGDDDEPLPWG